MGCWLVTGAAGYIGSHVIRSLQKMGREVIALDDFSTGDRRRLAPDVQVLTVRLHDPDFLPILKRGLFRREVDGIIHLAGKKSVPESFARPLFYYEQNVLATLAVLRAVDELAVGKIIYSSSAAVYGNQHRSLVAESDSTEPTSVYGASKLAGEWAVRDYAAQAGVAWAALRYFNVVGAAEATLADRGQSNLLPLIHRAVETGEALEVYGTDWPTPDGTCVRDYVHVEDVADAHTATATALARGDTVGVLNVGRGCGLSVLELIKAVQESRRVLVPYRVVGRRQGDAASVVADVTEMKSRVGWHASRDVNAMVAVRAR